MALFKKGGRARSALGLTLSFVAGALAGQPVDIGQFVIGILGIFGI